MYIVETGQHRRVVAGVLVRVGLAVLELPIGDQRLEFGVDGAKFVVSRQDCRRVEMRPLVGEQSLKAPPTFGAEPERRTVEQQTRADEPVDDVKAIFPQRRGQIGTADPAFQPDCLQHAQFAHDTPLSRIAASIASSGLADTTSLCPLAMALRTSASVWRSSRG